MSLKTVIRVDISMRILILIEEIKDIEIFPEKFLIMSCSLDGWVKMWDFDEGVEEDGIEIEKRGN
jgi:hypothetical protein